MNLGDIVATLKINAENFTGGLNNVGGQITDFISSGISSFGELAAGIATATAAVVAIGAAVIGAGIALATAADDNSGLKDSYDRLTKSINTSGDTMLDKMRDATRNTIPDIQLMTEANKLMNNGFIKNADDASNFMEIARKLGHSIGQDTTTSIDGLTTILETGRTKALVPYGIDVVELDKKIKEYSASHKDLTSKEAARIVILDTLREKTKGITDDHELLSERIKTVTTWFDNMKQSIGDRLVPVVNQLFDNLGYVKDLFQGFFEMFSSDDAQTFQIALENFGFSPAQVQQITDFVGGFVGGIQNLVKQIKEFGDKIGELINSPPVQQFIKIMKDIGENILKNLQSAFNELIKVFQEKLQPSLEKLFTALQPVFKVLGEVAAVIGGVLSIVIGKLIEIFTGALKPAIDIIIGVFSAVIDIITAVINWIVSLVTNIVDGANRWIAAFNLFKSQATAVWENLKIIITMAIEYIRAWIQEKIDRINDAFQMIHDVVEKVFNNVKTAIETAFNGAAEIVKGVVNQIINQINGVSTGINNMIDTVNKASGLNIGHVGNIKPLANGTDSFQGGLAITGEAGAELQMLPDGTSVTPAMRTQQLFDMIGGLYNNLVVNNPIRNIDLSQLVSTAMPMPAVHIHLNGANIMDINSAQKMAEFVGDTIIQKLRTDRRSSF